MLSNLGPMPEHFDTITPADFRASMAILMGAVLLIGAYI